MPDWVEADRLEINLTAQTPYFDDPCATDGVVEGQAPITGPTSPAVSGRRRTTSRRCGT